MDNHKKSRITRDEVINRNRPPRPISAIIKNDATSMSPRRLQNRNNN